MKKLIYKNFFGDYNILITQSIDECASKYGQIYTLVNDREIYDSHIWIHDNIVKKNFTLKKFFIIGSFISDDILKVIFKVDNEKIF